MDYANLKTVLPALLSTSLASLVEFIEALTIVLAVAAVRGWRSAIAGTAGGLLVLGLLVAILGPALTRIPLNIFQVVVGILVLLFGLRWLRKAILRSAGYIAHHDEAQSYNKEVEALRSQSPSTWNGIDFGAAITAFNGVFVEGLEVVFIVLAVGTTARRMNAAVAGASIALIVVFLLGLLLRAPLTKIPENTLKFLVGIMLSALGTVWTGEGIGLTWLGGNDWASAELALAYIAVASSCVLWLRTQKTRRIASS